MKPHDLPAFHPVPPLGLASGQPDWTVWSLDDPAEPLGHGGRLRGVVCMTTTGWRWRAAFGSFGCRVRGDYLDAERALLAATEPRSGSAAIGGTENDRPIRRPRTIGG
jgi:hypothetical protein